MAPGSGKSCFCSFAKFLLEADYLEATSYLSYEVQLLVSKSPRGRK